MNAGLSARGIIVEAGPRRLLDAVDIDVIPGQLTAVIGPNGADKSTLLKVLCGDIRPQSGTVRFAGKALSDWHSDALARRRAVLPQTPELAFHFQVGDVVALGRHPHAGHCSAATDARAIHGAMTAAAVALLAGQDCHVLSGGERHRTHYARVLAQLWDEAPAAKPRALLLDEPTAGLDLFHQHAILNKARALATEGVGVLAVLHDLNLAASYADRVVLIVRGRVAACGAPFDVLTEDCIRRIWQVDCAIMADSRGNRHIATFPSPQT